MNRPRLLAVSQLRRSDKRFESTISNSRGRLPMEPSGLINSVLLKLLSQLAIHLDTSKSVPTCTRWWRAQNQVDCIRKKNANYLSIIVVYRASNDFVPIASTDFIFTTDWSVVWHRGKLVKEMYLPLFRKWRSLSERFTKNKFFPLKTFGTSELETKEKHFFQIAPN